MATEIDINGISEEESDEFSDLILDYLKHPKNNPNFDCYRTDFNLIIKFFGNPIEWIKLMFAWDSVGGYYGIRIGPLSVGVEIIKYIKLKTNNNL